jgi:UDP-N-acetylmuramyl pentapeptide phosphotransferase/UDP-N-acetylglucosamine-1-phosphate transferase
VTGIAHAINLIDGFHGLSSGSVVIALLSFAVVGLRLNDDVVFNISIVFAAVVAGFFVVNFPNGKLFLGDGGAYFAGFMLGVIGIVLAQRHGEISPWVGVIVAGYPVTETVFSILRRRNSGLSPGDPDSSHLHHNIYRRWSGTIASHLGMTDAQNPITSVLLWPMSLFGLAYVCFSDLGTFSALASLAALITFYIYLYRTSALSPIKAAE